LAGERARPGCRFRRRAVPSAVRRGIFVEIGIIKFSSSVGAAYSDDVAPTELDSLAWLVLQRCQSYGLRRLRVLRATKLNRPLPRSSTPNCHWPPGWDIAGERARPGGRFRRRALASLR